MVSTFPEFRTSALLEREGFRHAFFTRRGGVSTGPFASLNFSVAVGDDAGNVARNLELAGGVLGVARERLYFLSQVHGADSTVVTTADDPLAVLHREGDAVASRDPGCAVGVRIADCVPILVADLRSGAALAIHAGWKGLVAGVIESGVATLRELGSSAGRLVAAIGPHITVSAFEVSPDVAETLRQAAPEASPVDRTFGPRPHVSLLNIARARLHALGLARGDVDEVPGCTFGDAAHFFSFRRDGKQSGRHLAAIVPRAPG